VATKKATGPGRKKAERINQKPRIKPGKTGGGGVGGLHDKQGNKLQTQENLGGGDNLTEKELTLSEGKANRTKARKGKESLMDDRVGVIPIVQKKGGVGVELKRPNLVGRGQEGEKRPRKRKKFGKRTTRNDQWRASASNGMTAFTRVEIGGRVAGATNTTRRRKETRRGELDESRNWSGGAEKEDTIYSK